MRMPWPFDSGGPARDRDATPPAAAVFLGALTLAFFAWTTRETLGRYDQFRAAWPWDLAYYNQWFWSLCFGDGLLTVRPFAEFAVEGPSIWKTNYLAPIRLAIAPLYALRPSPRTLLVVQNAVIALVIPASYRLARSESGSVSVALGLAALVPLTPLLEPLALNDFRELPMGLPFALWAVHAARERNARLAGVSVAALLACRQEFALLVASLALVPARQAEARRAALRWSAALLATGVLWGLLYFAYLAATAGAEAPRAYLRQMGQDAPAASERLRLAAQLVGIGLASWSVLGLAAPRLLVLALPWLWVLPGGLFELGMLAGERWTRVRYAAPLVGVVLAAGLTGSARLGRKVRSLPGGRPVLAAAWLVVAAGLLAGRQDVRSRLDRVPPWVMSRPPGAGSNGSGPTTACWPATRSPRRCRPAAGSTARRSR